MKRVLVTCFLSIVILVSFSFVWLKTQAAGPEDNYFNRELRVKLAARSWLRQLLGLHGYGDARADYLGGKYRKILIEVDVMNSLSARYEALDLLADRMAQATGKDVSYIISDKNIPYERAASDPVIKRLTARYRNRQSAGDTAVLYVLYASRGDEESLLGLTFEENAVVLFAETLAEFVGRNLSVAAAYETSTILHEAGHQLGLDHNGEEACLMNEHADQAHVPREDPDEVITDFCDYEKRLLSNFRDQ